MDTQIAENMGKILRTHDRQSNERLQQVIYAAVKGGYFAMLAALDGEVAARLKVIQEVFR